MDKQQISNLLHIQQASREIDWLYLLVPEFLEIPEFRHGMNS